MFSVIFEVRPKSDQWDAYLGYAKMLRPELEKVDGFVDNIRYRSLTRDGWILSLSNWRDEKAVVRWRTGMRHHEVQELGRGEVLADYHLRVGQITLDTRIPEGYRLLEQRLDETEVGQGTTITLLDAKRPSEWTATHNPTDCAEWFGVTPLTGALSWDIFDAVMTPGDLILMLSWQSREMAEDFEATTPIPEGARLRRIRVVRDYGMYDRREAPQYFPDAPNGTTLHS